MFKLIVTAVSFAVPILAQAGPWAQCGGIGWTGATTCQTGLVCHRQNDWYFQCLPDSNPKPTTTTSQGPTKPTPIATLCTQLAYYVSPQGYGVLNNLWGIDTATNGSQCTYYNGASGAGVAYSSAWKWEGDPNTVKSYIYSDRMFTRKRIADITRLPTTAEWTYNITDMRANVAYDIFTHTDPNHTNENGQYEVMIWLGIYGGIWPITESPTGSPVEQVKIAGYTWNLYTGYNGPMRVYSFLPANGPINKFNADVKEFFNYLTKAYAYPAKDQYMLIFQLGTEAFLGGPAYFDVTKYQSEVI